MFGIGVLIIFLSVIGVSYGYWINSETQNTFDVLGVKCFELTMSNETKGIHLEEAYPVTDEEGKEQEGYQFTIKNTCNTSATYQVNLEEKDLEESIKRLSDEYIKVSLNDSTGKNLDDYESTEATIKEEDFQADKSHKLTSGSLGPNEEETYTLKLWMDYDTPPIDDVMNAAFESKISIVATYIEEEKIKSNITIEYEEPDEYSNEKEIITFTVTGDPYDIIEYSLDGNSYNSLDESGTNVTLSLNFTEEKEYTIYFRDSLGNTKSETFTPSKLDQTGPELTINNPKEKEWTNESLTITLNAIDKISNIGKFYYSQDEGKNKTWNEISEVELDDKNETATLELHEEQEQTYYFKATDIFGNESEIKETTVKIDTTEPEITSLTTQNTWGESNTLTGIVQDALSGIAGYYFGVSATTPTVEWQLVKDYPIDSKTYTASAMSNTTWYFYVKDQAGNVSSKSVPVNKVDNGLPNIDFSISPDKPNGDNGWYKTTQPTVTVKATDSQSGVNKVEYCTTTNTNCTNYTNNLPLNGQNGELNRTGTLTLLEGSNSKVCVKVTDGVGKTSEGCSSGYNIDITAPTIGSVTGSLKDTSITFTANNVTESGSGTQIYSWTLSDQKTQTSEVNTVTFIGLTKGQTYTVFVTLKDKAGNVSNSIKSSPVVIPLPTAADTLKGVQIVTSGDGLYEVTPTAPAGWTTKELRYAGVNPNNYVTFNGELWRIIGLVNVKTTSNKIEQRIKIIRADSIGNYSWDYKTNGKGSSTSSYGSNDWTDSQLMEMLNGIYYNSQSGNCYQGSSSPGTCNFTSTGLNSTAQGMIATDIIWNLGGTASYTSSSTGLVTHWYGYERGTTVPSGRPTEWQASNTAKASAETTSTKVIDKSLFRGIALPYPSDYGYATSGGSTGRAACLAKEIYNWDSSPYKTDCAGNDWLKPASGYMWTLSSNSSYSYFVFYVSSYGSVIRYNANYSYGVWPALYLSSKVSISGGTGTSSSPYELSL